MNTKTPVSTLQELMVKRNEVPHYEFLPNSEGVGTHLPTFYCRVTAMGLSAIGKARAKKEAKHEAARLLLKSLFDQDNVNALPIEPAIPVEPTIKPESALPFKIEVNAVGELKDFCAEKNIPAPCFELISDIGPPHSRQFTIECTVGSVSVTGIDLTKKKAKHNAALKMLTRLQDDLTEVEVYDVPEDFKDDVIQKYNEISTLNKKINWGMKITEYPTHVERLMEEKTISYNELWEDYDDIDDIQMILDKLDLQIQTVYFTQKNAKIAFTTINTLPECTFMATSIDQKKATKETLQQLIEHLKLMSNSRAI